MKLAITISAAVALVAFSQFAAAAQTRQDFVVEQGFAIKVVDRVGTYPPQWPARPRHRFVYYRSYGLYLAACAAVIFPRSPLCAGRPASFGSYAPFPWNTWSYY
jgi:hypothetical protein